MKTTTNFRTLRLVQLALLTAIMVLMDVAQIGYIVKPGLVITTLVIPVTVGAIILGPTGGAILGAVFGITSLLRCFGTDPFGTIIFNSYPLLTIIMCMVPRILMGWLTGMIFKMIKKVDKTKSLSYAITSLIGPMLNTLFFLTALVLLFYNTQEFKDNIINVFGTSNVPALLIALAGINALIEIGICFVVGTAVTKAVASFTKSQG